MRREVAKLAQAKGLGRAMAGQASSDGITLHIILHQAAPSTTYTSLS